jgi:hypothetical protein
MRNEGRPGVEQSEAQPAAALMSLFFHYTTRLNTTVVYVRPPCASGTRSLTRAGGTRSLARAGGRSFKGFQGNRSFKDLYSNGAIGVDQERTPVSAIIVVMERTPVSAKSVVTERTPFAAR